MSIWDDYDRWNDAIAKVVFAPSDESRPVYLDLEDDLVREISILLDVKPEVAIDALCDVVGRTLTRADGPARVFAGHDLRLRRWRHSRRNTPPPHLAVLATFSLAAEQMARGDGMSANNYFGRLRKLLRWDDSDAPLDHAYRRVAERYWGELNAWLIQTGGERGTPTAFSLAHRHVGLSVSQALVRSADRERFKDFFHLFGFAPGSHVAPSDLVPLLNSWIQQPQSPVTASLARLWESGQARPRIAEAVTVTLASWDGSMNARGTERSLTSDRLTLTLELSGFPRKRFTISALFYVPQAQLGRSAELLTAARETHIDLIPDTAGALGLAPGSSLHPDDVLAGILRVRDSHSGATLERRPKRLVVFREDELSRRWVEVKQVMLGDDLRLLAENGLADRVSALLQEVARPGWEIAAPYPGQPDGWTLFTGVEILNHAGSLISANRLDDLAALVPLTASTLKVSGGFAIPGSVRGKWHIEGLPEIRAVSDAPLGFVARLIELDRSGDSLEEREVASWSDNGSGVVIQSLAGLGLEEGDFRLELLNAGSRDPVSSSMIYLRSGNSRDERQWHLAESITYGGGIGVLGVETNGDISEVHGHAVIDGPHSGEMIASNPPAAPTWSKKVGSRQVVREPMRITVPDADSCIRTGKHHEDVDMVQHDSKGRPVSAWTFGRCRTCGLVKRYPTSHRRAKRAESTPEQSAPISHDLRSVAPIRSAGERPNWTIALDTLFHLGGGSWSSLEKVALQVEPSGLFLDHFARTLEVLGHISIRRDSDTLRPLAWEISPTQLSGCASGYAFNGHWPLELYGAVVAGLEADGTDGHVDGDEPTQFFADATAFGVHAQKVIAERDVAVLPAVWRDLALHLPPLSQILEQLPRHLASADGEISWFDVDDASWKNVGSYGAPGAYRIRKFGTLDVVRSKTDVDNGTFARSTVHLGKHLAALIEGRPLAAYDRPTRAFMVPIGAELPGLYGRALVAASCLPPLIARSAGSVVYQEVPEELAEHMYDLLSR
ncbi:hypothetical protein [Aeromicrobium duanguangcaii]|uniref:hypothetical protein n=1 Tax=Aeromicrobium duanguangcaii TaxID=2968086 RepID=UPI0020179A48|nr:hypothetical protein [Aeromicrobium duanguangcaii]MCL3836864.1 hypothetical protein [Aeromicrobium duanguangcaii]